MWRLSFRNEPKVFGTEGDAGAGFSDRAALSGERAVSDAGVRELPHVDVRAQDDLEQLARCSFGAKSKSVLGKFPASIFTQCCPLMTQIKSDSH